MDCLTLRVGVQIKQQMGMLPSEQYLIKIWELFTYCCAVSTMPVAVFTYLAVCLCACH